MFEMTGGPIVLTEEERERLGRLEGQLADLEVQEGRAGWALREIRERRLYRETYLTFEIYCHERWNRSRQSVNRLIAHGRPRRQVRSRGP
jgi:hypothetical protein